jgi:uncharacterized membrane protein YhaH (DUF805 family)
VTGGVFHPGSALRKVQGHEDSVRLSRRRKLGRASTRPKSTLSRMAKTQSSMLRGKLPGPIQSPSSKNWYLQPWKKYGDFTGRAPRAEFWGFFFSTLWSYYFSTRSNRRAATNSGGSTRSRSSFLRLPSAFAGCTTGIGVATSRLPPSVYSWPHGRSYCYANVLRALRSWGLCVFITAYACIIASDACLLMLTVLLATKGDPGSNRFGPPPTNLPPPAVRPFRAEAGGCCLTAELQLLCARVIRRAEESSLGPLRSGAGRQEINLTAMILSAATGGRP